MMSSEEQDGLSQGMTLVGLYLKSDKFQVHLFAVLGFYALLLVVNFAILLHLMTVSSQIKILLVQNFAV